MPPNLKNLSYESNEPSFLRKLRAENTGITSDRQERPVARPKRSKNADDEDGPTYVLEESNDTLSKAEYEALVNGEASTKKVDSTHPGKITTEEGQIPDEERNRTEEKDAHQPRQQTTGIGQSQKKRKLGKIIGADDANKVTSEKKTEKKPKKTTKVVKLSFGDDAAG